MNERYKLIHWTKTARFYKLSKLSTYSENDKQKEPYQYVLIADSDIYTKRLAFSFRFEEGSEESDLLTNKKNILKVDFTHLCGYLILLLIASVTSSPPFVIHGGDINSVYPDEWYLDKITKNI